MNEYMLTLMVNGVPIEDLDAHLMRSPIARAIAKSERELLNLIT